MRFENPREEIIARLLRNAKTIAVIGLSADPQRPSHGVAKSLERFGYRVIPVNPHLDAWNGVAAAPDLESAQRLLTAGERIDIVDVFRRPEHVDGIVDECIRLDLPALWLQIGVVNRAAAQRARTAGIEVVMDLCLYVERARLV